MAGSLFTRGAAGLGGQGTAPGSFVPMPASKRLAPTASCTILVPILGAMLLAAVNYDNNLVYLVLFFVTSITIVSAVHTWRCLEGIELLPGSTWPVFAGDTLRLTIQVHNRLNQEAHSLWLEIPQFAGAAPSSLPRRGLSPWQRLFRLLLPLPPSVQGDEESEMVQVPYIPARGMVTVEFRTTAERRGHDAVLGVRVASEFPLGLFRVTRVIPLLQPYVVYPAARGELPPPEVLADAADQDDGHLPDGDNFNGVRLFRPGDSQRRIDWKAVARGRPMVVKEFTGAGTGRVWFDVNQLTGLSTEERLSQVTRWIVDSDEAECPYGLRLGTLSIEPDLGEDHRHRCLTLLAEQPREISLLERSATDFAGR
ncbi:hypothetical protein DB346_21950 [Verrucomicrobia bacterium LW23]|nr:hypothetical protein DB346_21950 [Verrucomicrobia bacterium LW23]